MPGQTRAARFDSGTPPSPCGSSGSRFVDGSRGRTAKAPTPRACLPPMACLRRPRTCHRCGAGSLAQEFRRPSSPAPPSALVERFVLLQRLLNRRVALGLGVFLWMVHAKILATVGVSHQREEALLRTAQIADDVMNFLAALRAKVLRSVVEEVQSFRDGGIGLAGFLVLVPNL